MPSVLPYDQAISLSIDEHDVLDASSPTSRQTNQEDAVLMNGDDPTSMLKILL